MILLILNPVSVLNAGSESFPPTGTLVVLNISDSMLGFISLKSGRMSAMLPIDKGPHKIAVSPDGKTAVITNHDFGEKETSLTVIDIFKQKVVKRIDLKKYGQPRSIVYLPNENSVLLSIEGDHSLLKVNVKRGKVIRSMKIGNNWVTRSVGVSSDGARAYVTQLGWATFSIVDLNRFDLLKIIDIGSATDGFDISPDDKEIWVAVRANNIINIVDSEKLKVVGAVNSGNFPVRLKFTVDGTRVVVSNAKSGDISIINTSTRKEIHRLKLDPSSIDSKILRLWNSNLSMGENPKPIDLAIHPGGTYLYVAISNAYVIAEIDLHSFKITRLLNANGNPGGIGYSQIN